MSLLSLQDVDLAGKTVLIREDLNVPMSQGAISNDARLRAAVPTIQQALDAGAGVLLLSHLGRPTEGEFDPSYSLAILQQPLSALLGVPVRFEKDYLDGVTVAAGDVVLCENVRFNIGEKANDEALAKRYAQLADIFVMDAFATAHRAQASTAGVSQWIETAVAGPLLLNELNRIEQATLSPEHPVLAVIGGAKVSNKLSILTELASKVDHLIVGGGIANTFLAAAGFSVGQSLYEADLIPAAKELMQSITARGGELPLPSDVAVAKSFSAEATAEIKQIDAIADDDLILDIGPDTATRYEKSIAAAKTIIWSGPIGVFEFPNFAAGTERVAKAIAKSSAYSLAGGGDTVSAIEQSHVGDQISYLSTGGGAFLKTIEGSALPAVEALKTKSSARSATA